MMDFFKYDFDYSWPWTYGHLIAAVRLKPDTTYYGNAKTYTAPPSGTSGY